jgi:uncharacterized protein YqjF (DUF2071 family)
MSFLKAEWRRLALANYEIDPAILKPYLPYKTELDTWNNLHYVSLVGFLFKDTKILGFKIPFHITFEEVNLRFYVRHKHENKWRRGVVFVKEIVPKMAITLVANTLYKEDYQTMQMKHLWKEKEDKLLTTYQWKYQDNWNTFSVESDNKKLPIEKNSDAEFITEHYYGYTKIKANKTFEYEVKHPSWEQYKVIDYKIELDFRQMYGIDFACLNGKEPNSVMLAEGSEASVENKRTL